MTNEAAKPIVIVTSTKSVGVAILLTFFFGPLGMFYSTISGALIMMGAAMILGILTIPVLGIGVFLAWPASMIWSALAAKAYNKKLLAGAVPQRRDLPSNQST